MIDLVIGTANFSNLYANQKFKNKDFIKVKNYIKKNKIRSFDIAEKYQAYHQVKKIIDKNSKVILKFNLSEEFFLEKKIFRIIKEFKTNPMYSVLAHDQIQLMNKNFMKNLNLLLDLKRKGFVKKIGFSIYDEIELKKIRKILVPDIIQLPLNIFDQRFLKSANLKKLKKQGSEIHVRSIFLQGNLLKEPKNEKLHKKYIKNFNYFENFCYKNKLSQLSACIQFIKQNYKLYDYIVIGFSNFNELKEIRMEFKKNIIKKLNFSFLNFSHKKKLIDPRKW